MPDTSAPAQPISYRPDLPDWGAYLRWPLDGDAWIHPEDLEAAQKLIPSHRVFRRSMWDGQYYWLHYGNVRLRVRPTMWYPVQPVDLEVGQQVELLSRNGENDAGIFRIREILFDPKRREIEFYLRLGELSISRAYSRSDLRLVHVRYQLRAGFFKHQPPKSLPTQDLNTLNVGNVLDG